MVINCRLRSQLPFVSISFFITAIKCHRSSATCIDMPVSHVGLTVAHLPTSCSFFLAALSPLGYRYLGQEGNQIAFGKSSTEFFISQESEGCGLLSKSVSSNMLLTGGVVLKQQLLILRSVHHRAVPLTLSFPLP